MFTCLKILFSPIQNPSQKSVLVVCLMVIVNILTKKEKRYFLNSLFYVLEIKLLNFIVFKNVYVPGVK